MVHAEDYHPVQLVVVAGAVVVVVVVAVGMTVVGWNCFQNYFLVAVDLVVVVVVAVVVAVVEVVEEGAYFD